MVESFIYQQESAFKSALSIDSDGKNLLWTSDIKQELPIRYSPHEGIAAVKPRTLLEVFFSTAISQNSHQALIIEREDKILKWTWKQYSDDVLSFAKGLIKYGVQPRKTLNFIGPNSPEQLIAFFGAISANCVASGVYATNQEDLCFYQAEHSEAQAILIEANIDQIKKYHNIQHKLPEVKVFILYETSLNLDFAKLLDQAGVSKEERKKWISYSDFLKCGKEIPSTEVAKRLRMAVPGQCCCLLYTSGTTGNPKGVMLSHDNLCWTYQSFQATIQSEIKPLTSKERIVSFLPLSHIAAVLFDIAQHTFLGCTLYFAKPDALSGSLVQTLQWVKPTVFLAVPRVWEKFELALKNLLSSYPSYTQKIANWAMNQGFQNSMSLEGKEKPYFMGLAEYIKINELKKIIGLEKCRLQFFGAAPMKPATIQFFASLDLPLINLYGMTESSGPTTGSSYKKFKMHASGFAIEGSDLDIKGAMDQSGEGEICFRGRQIMMGYFKNEQATKDTIDSDGFLHSGDIGKIDSDGFLTVTGRIKELIVTAGGENVAPVLIEDALKSICPVLSNAMAVGDQEPFIGALLTLKADIDKLGKPTNVVTPEARLFFQSKLGVNVQKTEEAIANEKVRQYIQECIDKVNQKAVSRASMIRKFEFLPLDFSLAGEELTPTMKLRRNVTVKKHKAVIDKIYNQPKL